MTTYHAKDAKVEISSDGERWQEILIAPPQDVEFQGLRSVTSGAMIFGAFGVFSSLTQAQAAAFARAEEAQLRDQILERYYPGVFSVPADLNRSRAAWLATREAHSRHAMRHRKLRRYKGLDKKRA